jgi:hypothetical protein
MAVLKRYLSQFTRREQILFTAVAVYLAVHFAQSLLFTLKDYEELNFYFVQNILFKVLYPIFVIYALSRREFWGYAVD